MTAQNSCYRSIKISVCVCILLVVGEIFFIIVVVVFICCFVIVLSVRKQWFLNCLEHSTIPINWFCFVLSFKLTFFPGLASTIFLFYFSCVHTNPYTEQKVRAIIKARTTTKTIIITTIHTDWNNNNNNNERKKNEIILVNVEQSHTIYNNQAYNSCYWLKRTQTIGEMRGHQVHEK